MSVSSRSSVVGGSVSSSHSRRDASKERFWREAVAERAASGVSIRDYCRERGLSEANFYAWRRELALRDAEPARREAGPSRPTPRATTVRSAVRRAKDPAFAKVRVIEAASEHPTEPLAPPSSAMEIVFADNLRLQLHGPVDAESLASVVRVLREAPSC